MVVPAADDELGFSGHAGVDGVASQETAKDAVVGIGRQAANHVTGIDVFDVDIDFFITEIGDNGFL